MDINVSTSLRRARSPFYMVAAVTLVLSSACTSGTRFGAAGSPSLLPNHTAQATPSVVPGENSTALENDRPGFASWPISNLGQPHEIEGWAHTTSAAVGQPVDISVSTTAPSFRIKVFRMGWYHGKQARLVEDLGPFKGHMQHQAKFLAPTRTYYSDWPTSLSLPTDGFVPGTYLLRLEAASGGQRFVPFTLRAASAVNRVVMINAVTTWAAYNTWGGTSLYHGTRGEGDFAGRAYAVSFDRPYQGDGAGDFVGNELPAIALAEKLGLDLQYVTDIDLHDNPAATAGARALISLGHDEYYSNAMRATLTAARDRGVNLAFLGANAIFRRIRLQPSAMGADRIVVCYKRSYPDPENHLHPSEVTTDWREPPVSRPESSLVGTLYECNPTSAPMIVGDTSSWIWAGVAPAGTVLIGVIGAEYDRVNPGFPTPKGIEVLTHSPVTCRGVHSFSDSAYYTTHDAGVFSTGTGSWVGGLTVDAAGRCSVTVPRCDVLREVTTRVLLAFADGPAGLTHPAEGNLAHLHEFAGDAIAAGHQDPRKHA